MKIIFYEKDDCQPCILMKQHIILLKVLFKIKEIDLEIEYKQDEEVPKLEFYKDEQKIGELKGIPMLKEQEYSSMYVMRNLFEACYHSTGNEDFVKYIKACDEIYKADVIDVQEELKCEGC